MSSAFSVFELEKRKWELSRAEREQQSSGVGDNRQEGPASPEERTEHADKLYLALLSTMRTVRGEVRKGLPPRPELAQKIYRRMLADGLAGLVYERASLDEQHADVVAATVYVSLAAMKVGQGLGYDDERLLWLALGGLFVNIGLYRFPDRLEALRYEDLSPQDRAKMRTHPQLGEQIIEDLGEEYLPLCEMVLQAHEREDGSGYPSGLQGEEIAEPASIIGLVEHVVSLREARRIGNRFIQTSVIKQVVDREGRTFSRRILKEFLDQISLFPVNTYIRLNNDSIGRVLATYKEKPMRPTIELLYDGRGKKKESPKLVHLESFPLLHIVEALEDEDALQHGFEG